MTEPHAIRTLNVLDIMAARAKVREIARAKGLCITEQARIALATSSVADLLGLGTLCRGQITIEGLEEKGRTGVQVVCTAHPGTRYILTAEETAITKTLVDDLTIQLLPPYKVSVTLIQWAA